MKRLADSEYFENKRAMARVRMRRCVMVLLFVLFLPCCVSAVWSGDRGYEEWELESGLRESRIVVRVMGSKGEMEMSMEEYLYGCLPTVIPGEYEMECLKAQAVLMRTYLIGRYREAVESGKDVVEESGDSYFTKPRLKELWGEEYAVKSEKVRQAVNQTRGIYAAYEGLPIEACFFRVSAGRTRDGNEVLGREIPYLKSVACPKDYLSEDYLTQISIKKKELERILGGSWGEIKCDSAGYCQNVTLYITNKEGKEETIGKSGEWLRQKLMLPSAFLLIEEEKKNMQFTSKGTGHGLGMSQFAANEMAKDGDDYSTILCYFFQNIALDKYE